MKNKFLLFALSIFSLSVFAQSSTQWNPQIFQNTVQLANRTATTVPYLDSSKILQSSAVTPTELGFVHNVTSNLCGINQSCTVTNKSIDGGTNTITNVSLSAGVTGTLPITNGGTGLNSTSQNFAFIGPTSGSGAPTWRALIGGDLPNPAASTLGGVRSLAATSHQWINTISTSGIPASTQPAFSDISGTASLTTQVTGTLPFGNGGTGQTAYTDGQLLIGNTSTGGLSKATLTQGSNITITNGNGSITIAASSAAAPAYNYTAQTSNYSAVINDWVLASGASFNITLPTAIGQSGKAVVIQHNGTSISQLYTLLTSLGQSINGPGGVVASGNYVLYTNGEKLILLSDGSNWQVIQHDTLTGWNSGGTFNISATAAFVISWTGNQSIVQGDTYSDGSGNIFTVTTTANTTSGTFSGITSPAATGTLTRQTGTGVTPITWTSRTTTGQPVFGTNTNSVQWMRSGKNWTVRWILNQTVAGTGGSGDYIAYTPTGIALDTTVTPVYVLGPAAILLNNAPAFASIVTSMVAATQNSASTLGGVAIPYSATSFRFTGGTTSASNVGSGNIALGGTTIGYNFSATFPGAGLQP